MAWCEAADVAKVDSVKFTAESAPRRCEYQRLNIGKSNGSSILAHHAKPWVRSDKIH